MYFQKRQFRIFSLLIQGFLKVKILFHGGEGDGLHFLKTNPPFPSNTIITDEIKSKIYFWICKKGNENCKMSGQMREKPRNFEMEGKWPPCKTPGCRICISQLKYSD